MAYYWKELQDNPNKGYYLTMKEVKYFEKYAKTLIQEAASKSGQLRVDDLEEALRALSLAISYNNDCIEMYHLPSKAIEDGMKKGLSLLSLYEVNNVILEEEKKNIKAQKGKNSGMKSTQVLWKKPRKPPQGLAEEGMKRFGHCIRVPDAEANDEEWDSIVGNEETKKYIRNAVVYPVIFGEQYPDKVRSKGVLLYGPPGTGKSMIGRAIATKLRICYLKLEPAELLNKYVGESEKNVRLFFALVEYLLPCLVFIDEIDCILGRRDGESSSQESKRGMTNQLLQAMDGKNGLFIIGATNIPWQIDPAFMRRLDAKFYIALPNEEERFQIILHWLKDISHSLLRCDMRALAKKTDGLSGSDIVTFLKKANVRRFDKAERSKYFAKNSLGVWQPCTPGNPGCEEITLQDITARRQPHRVPNLSKMDLEVTKFQEASDKADIAKFEEFSRKF